MFPKKVTPAPASWLTGAAAFCGRMKGTMFHMERLRANDLDSPAQKIFFGKLDRGGPPRVSS